jgi:prefoldin subunit 5
MRVFPIVAVLVLVGAAGAQDAVKKEMALLEGEWSMISGEANGLSMSKETVSSGKRVAAGGETTVTIGGALYFKAKLTLSVWKRAKE